MTLARAAASLAAPQSRDEKVHAAALVDHVAHDLEALEVPLALAGERPGERLEHADLVLARLPVGDRGQGGERDEQGGEREGEVPACHAEPPERWTVATREVVASRCAEVKATQGVAGNVWFRLDA